MEHQWSLVQTLAPTAEPITATAMREHVRQTINDDDATLSAMISAARVYAETFLNRQLMPATYRLAMDCFPGWTIKVPMPPLTSISSITYLDTAGTVTTLNSSLYVVDTDSTPGRITPAYSTIWPTTRSQMAAVKVTFVAGYASAQVIPATVIQAIKMIAAHLYENREETVERSMANVPMGAVRLLESERVLDFSGPLGAAC